MKVEKATPDKPEVFAIAEMLGIDPDSAFGKCFRIWRWFDDHTTNGKANGCCVSKMLVDRLVGVKGFADCMVSVGWLIEDGSSVCASNFERHNGETAKTRALTAKRVAKHTQKANAEANAKLTVDALPREEKRREDISSSLRSEDKRVSRFDAKAHLVGMGVESSIAADWVQHRKALKAAPSLTAIDGIAKESERAGISLSEALAMCCQRGWRGFKADWVASQKPTTYQTKKEINDSATLRALGLARAPTGFNVIEGETA